MTRQEAHIDDILGTKSEFQSEAQLDDEQREELIIELPQGPVLPSTRKSMVGNKRRDTKPEIIVRQMLRKLGYPGYRLDWKKAPGHPDIAYPGRKIAIFVHGCFWHRCPVCNLSTPKSNPGYWQDKFARNKERDERTKAALEEAGWKVIVIWEHQLKKKNLAETEQYLYEMVRLPSAEECSPSKDQAKD